MPRWLLCAALGGASALRVGGPGAGVAPQHASAARPRASAALAAAPEYGAEQITVLEGLEPVRKRPGMYIGSTGPRGLHHLVYEVVDNSVDEALAGHATRIDVRLRADGSISVSDDGRGIPCDVHAKTGRPALETVLTVLHAGGKFGDAGYKVSSGLHGVGVSVVNALSSSMDVTVRRAGSSHSIGFARGQLAREMAITPLAAGEKKASGTTVVFTPDTAIFKAGVEFDWATLSTRFDEQAYLNAGLNITMTDERPKRPTRRPVSASADDDADDDSAAAAAAAAAEAAEEAAAAAASEAAVALEEAGADAVVTRSKVFCHEGGIAEYVDHICEGKKPLLESPASIVVSDEVRGVGVEIALRWNSDMYTDTVLGFANGVHTPQGGTHVDGLKSAVTRVLNSQARVQGKLKEKAASLPGDFLREGLVAVISVRLPEAEFEGQTKNRLGNPEVRAVVSEVLTAALTEFAQTRPKALALIIEKAGAAAKAAEAAKAARELVRRKTVLGSSVLPGKLADCSSSSAEDTEVFIVEGDSAGGSAKQGRNRDVQAILPMRGKILNIEKAEDAQIYGNAEIQALITALGLGIKGDDFKPASLRYHKIIIMTDADVDGAHIRTLLLTFFFRYQRELLLGGFVYIAYPPLYKVRHRGKVHYAYTEAELRELSEKFTGKFTMQRFKGLGEMMPAELWSTTMDPSTRMLKRVDVQDAADADRLLSVLMGNAIVPRKAFIHEHAETMDWSTVS